METNQESSHIMIRDVYSHPSEEGRVRNKAITSETQNSATNAYNCNSGVNNNNKNNNNSVVVAYECHCNDEHVTLEEVEDAYLECRRNKRYSRGAVEYEMGYELNNLCLWKELNEGRYEVGRSVAFCVTRPKLREVFAADFRDRIVHHIIMRRFMPLFESRMIDDSYNCRKGKGTLYGVNRIREKMERLSEDYTKVTWVMKCDLSGFFMSIDRTRLKHRIEDVVRSGYDGNDVDWWLSLIFKVIDNRCELNCEKRGDVGLWDRLPKNKSLFCSDGKGLPIGNLTSQIFANLYLAEFDRWVNERMGEWYGRYVDDFVVMSHDKAQLLRFADDARKWLKRELGLTLHPRKFHLQEAKKGIQFVGTYIKPGRTYTGNRTVENAMAVIDGWNRRGGDASKFAARMNSYMGFLVHNNTYGIRWTMWNAIRRRNGLYNENMKKICLTTKNKKL